MSRFYSFWGTFSERKNGIAYLFSAPAGRDARTAQAVRPDGRKVSRRTSAGSAPSADGGDVAVPAAGAKRKGHLRFPFLFELLPFPCFLIWRKPETGDRFEKGYGRGFFLPCFSQPVRSTRYITATQTGKSTQARHARVAQLVSLEITDSTYEDKLYLIDRFAGAFRHNAQKIWSALLCRPLRRVTNMCSSNLSVNCEYFTKFTLR